MSKELTYETVVSTLVEHVPELRALRDDHYRQYGEILPHVFFGDLTRFVQTGFACPSSSSGRQVVMRILDLLERTISSVDNRLQELVSVSFLENLDQDSSAFAQIRASLGPRLKEELAKYKSN
jgi:hypothetical protein